MKKTILFCILLVATKAFTQTVPANEVSLDQMLVNIDKTTVTSGVIYQRVTPFANLYSFNTNTNRNTADFKFFKQALLEMYLASNQTQFTSVDELNNNLNTIVYDDNSVDMGILNTPFQILNYNEENPSLGRLQYNETSYLFYPSTDTSLPLFHTSHTTVISPLKEVVKGDYISFNWLMDFNFENSLDNTKKIKNLTVDYGTGTSYTVISNYIITNATQQITYLDTGEKLITFSIIYSDNTSLTTYAKIKYIKIINNPLARMADSEPNCGSEYGLREHNKEIVSDYEFQGYDESFAFRGFINYDVFYRKAAITKNILKPIVIIDGFDPGDKRKVLPCDYEPFEYKVGESRSISEVMKYGANKEKDLISELQNKGYDVIIVNQPTYAVMNTAPYQKVDIGTIGSRTVDGGGDYIERNGLNLVTLIKRINAELITNGSTEKLVIVGPSMGGQISRYALAYMEKNNIQHNTRLWVSVDSPHLGANIPLGAQAEINLLKNGNDQAEDFYNNQLGSVAAKQQLIEFHKEGDSYHTVDQLLLNAKTISQGFSTNSGSTFFQNFYNNQFSNGLPNSKGYPINLRKIALTNGSLTGNKIGTDSQQTLNVRGFADVCLLFCFKVHAASMEIYTMPNFSSTSKISRFKSGLNGDKTTIAPNINSRGNMDIVPGGYFNSYDQLHNSIMAQSGPTTNFAFPFYFDLSPEDINLESRVNTKINSFIPTFSALGIKNPEQDWGQSLNRNLVCSGETPFDSYYGEANNTEHTSFNYNSVSWLFKELGDNTNPPIAQAPTFPINNSELSGTDKLCVGQTSTYSFTDICKIPSAVTWSVSSNLQIMSYTTTSVTIKGLANNQGTLTATFQNGMTVTKDIWVGVPAFNLLRTSVETCDGIKYHYVNFEINPPPAPGTTFTFNFPTPNVTYTMTSFGKYQFRFLETYDDFFEILVTATNNCGSYPVYSEEYISSCTGGALSRLNTSTKTKIYKIYPNPSDDVVNVSLADEALKPVTTSKIVAELYDFSGQPQQKVEVKNNIASIYVGDLQKGVYILKINVDGKTEGHQVIIE